MMKLAANNWRSTYPGLFLSLVGQDFTRDFTCKIFLKA